MKPNAIRNLMLAKIHVAKKELSLSDVDYRAVLNTGWSVESAKELTDPQLIEVINHFKSKGWQPNSGVKKKFGETKVPDIKPGVDDDRKPLINKIEAQLSELGRLQGRRVSWAYAEAILRRQGGERYLNWASNEALENVIRALFYALKKAEAKAQATAV
jgi:phage gp16-like protein